MNDVLNEYEDHADALSDVFLTLDSAAIFAPVAEYFPAPPGRVLDLAAGPGRDARYMADLGFDVTAVEPIETFRIRGAEVVPEARWIDELLGDQRSHIKSISAKNTCTKCNSSHYHW